MVSCPNKGLIYLLHLTKKTSIVLKLIYLCLLPDYYYDSIFVRLFWNL